MIRVFAQFEQAHQVRIREKAGPFLQAAATLLLIPQLFAHLFPLNTHVSLLLFQLFDAGIDIVSTN